MSTVTAVLASLAAASLALTALEHACLRRLLARRRPAGGPRPPISVLKPLKGIDDGLYENLVTFARQRYPAFELLFGTPDRDDPAIAVVERLRAEFPHVPMSVTVCERPCLALLPVKDLLVAGTWAVAAVRRRVEWRGTVLRIGQGSRLLRVRRARGVAAPRGARRPGVRS